MKSNDLNTYPVPAPPALPPAGQTFQDPTFGTTILRVTDANTPGSVGFGYTNAYSGVWDMFNVDSSRFSFIDGGGGNNIGQLDVANKKVSNFQSVNKPGGTYYWSRINPNILYAVEQWAAARIWKYDCAASAWTLIVDLSTLLPALTALGPNASWCGSRGLSWDDNRIHINALNGCYVYDVSAGKLVGPYTLAMAQATAWKPDPTQLSYLFNKQTMDSTGKVFWTADTNLVFNVETGASFVPGFGTPANQYGDVHADSGLGGVLVGTGGAAPAINDGFYPFVATVDPNNLSSYLTPRKVVGPRFYWGVGVHTSFRDAAGKWLTNSNDPIAIFGADLGKVPIFGPEIFQLSVSSPPDGSVNRRIAHHQSDASVFPDAATQYWATAKASGSQDNRVVGWGSTFGQKRIDLFIAFLDDTTATGQSSSPGPQGPPGPVGPPGPAGPAGPSGVTGLSTAELSALKYIADDLLQRGFKP